MPHTGSVRGSPCSCAAVTAGLLSEGSQDRTVLGPAAARACGHQIAQSRTYALQVGDPALDVRELCLRRAFHPRHVAMPREREELLNLLERESERLCPPYEAQ